jgi:hypothetical protein
MDIKPTPEMIAAGEDAVTAHWSDYVDGDGRDHTSELIREVYVAMRRLERVPLAAGLKQGTASISCARCNG